MHLNVNSSGRWQVHAYQPQGAILLKTTSCEVVTRISPETDILKIGIPADLLEIPRKPRIIRNLVVRVVFAHHHPAHVCPFPHTHSLDRQWTTSSLPLSWTTALA